VSQQTESISIRWLEAADRETAGERWTDLERRYGDGALTSSWDWTSTWLANYGDVVPHRFAVGESADGPCGIALVARGVGRRRGPFAVRSIHLGTAGEPPGEGVFVEYNRVLADPRRRETFVRTLLTDLRQDASWHEVVLDGFVPEDAELFLTTEPAFVARRERCPTMNLREAADRDGDVIALLRSATRRKVRRSLEALGDVTTEWAETAEHAVEILDELIDLHQRRWESAGEPGAFASPRFRGFHRDLVARLAPSGRAILFRVRAGERTVGCLYNLIERRRALFYQSGLNSFEDGRISPGFVAFASCMQACFERGLEEYDFLQGEARYKRELSTMSRELVWATARRPSLRWQLMDALARGRDRLAKRGGNQPGDTKT
jgi:CelD/BcsL family acetyltransferase involved in cellulose biosynthesis